VWRDMPLAEDMGTLKMRKSAIEVVAGEGELG
jgi:hypothetical protein